jgi:plastocyanin
MGSPDPLASPATDGEPVLGDAAAAEPGADGETVADDVAAVPEVSIVNVAFEPADIALPVGTTMHWTNDDLFAHTVTARDGTFDSGTMEAGEIFSQTFDAEGAYEYLCAIHPSMTGTVTVTSAEGG